MIVELISVGTEIILGNILNTNANYLSIQCAELGFSLYYQVAVGDNPTRLKDTLKTALNRSDIVILTGGLGPTQDDLTKEMVAETLNRSLYMDEKSKERILGYFHKGNQRTQALTKITENNWKQALAIDGCIILENANGTAPGYIIEDNGKIVILLPGPPNELVPMFQSKVLPYLQKLQDGIFVSKMVKICGIGESRAETMILDLIDDQSNPTIAPYAKTGECHFRITAAAKTEVEAQNLLDPVILELTNRFGQSIYTLEESITLEEVVVTQLMEHNYTLATAESCTGGLLAGRIVNVSGVSQVLKEGYITYANEAKVKSLGVKEETLAKYGAVSEETAREMVLGLAKVSGCDVGISVTGIAGPEGGTMEKPIGLVYIACYVKGQIVVKEYHFRGSREKIREQSVIAGLDLIRRNII